MAEAEAATIAVRVRRIEPQVEYTLDVSPEVRSRSVSPLLRSGACVSGFADRLG